MKPPRIHGSEAKCRTAVARYIREGDEILDQADGVRDRVGATKLWILAFHIETEWERQVRRWFVNSRKTLTGYLQDQLPDVLPILAEGLPSEHTHGIGIENGEPWLRNAVEELRGLQQILGVRRDVSRRVAAAPARFEELTASGLVDPKVIDDHANDLVSPRTPTQLQTAIASSKELTEATLRGALDRLGAPCKASDSLPTLMKKWRKAVEELASPDSDGKSTLDGLLAAFASQVNFLAKWRNDYRRGHGRSRYPAGLKLRHARLAADTAETCIRFIVTTMDDLERLPPKTEE